jgi:hypothetical protein
MEGDSDENSHAACRDKYTTRSIAKMPRLETVSSHEHPFCSGNAVRSDRSPVPSAQDDYA